jgi:glucokinase
VASGWGISSAARQRVRDDRSSAAAIELLSLCKGDVDTLTTKQLADAAMAGNEIARLTMEHAVQVLGWGIGQVVTLLAPETVVVGGGVSLIGDAFMAPLRVQTRQYCFPPLRDTFTILPAELGEHVVVHGAVLLARSRGE